MGVAVGILLICRLEPEIGLGVIYPSPHVAGIRCQNTVAGTSVKTQHCGDVNYMIDAEFVQQL